MPLLVGLTRFELSENRAVSKRANSGILGRLKFCYLFSVIHLHIDIFTFTHIGLIFLLIFYSVVAFLH